MLHYLLIIIFFGNSSVCLQSGTNLYGETNWYQKAMVKEQIFDGKLIRFNGTIGPENRRITWILQTEKGKYVIYDPEKRIPLKLMNTQVHILGKKINDIDAHILDEIWPAHIE